MVRVPLDVVEYMMLEHCDFFTQVSVSATCKRLRSRFMRLIREKKAHFKKHAKTMVLRSFELMGPERVIEDVNFFQHGCQDVYEIQYGAQENLASTSTEAEFLTNVVTLYHYSFAMQQRCHDISPVVRYDTYSQLFPKGQMHMDVHLVQVQTNEDEATCFKALWRERGDLVNAIKRLIDC